MNKIEFMNRLSNNLAKLPSDERNDALNYYDELFADAGIENENKILNDLESPEDIARQILIENGINPDGTPEFMVDKTTDSQPQNNQPNYNTSKSTDGSKIALIIILIIITFPLWIGFVAAAFGIAVAAIAVAFSLVVACVAAAVGLLIGGIICLFTVPPIGIIMLGAGLIFSGLSALFIIPLCKLIIKGIIGVVNGFVNLIRRIVHGKQVA